MPPDHSRPALDRQRRHNNAVRGLEYGQLSQDTGIPVSDIESNQRAYGNLSQVGKMVGNRDAVFSRQSPVNLAESMALFGGSVRHGLQGFLPERALKNLTDSNALVRSALERYANPTGATFPPRANLFAMGINKSVACPSPILLPPHAREQNWAISRRHSSLRTSRGMSVITDYEGPDFFHILGIAMRQGREFTTGDTASSTPVAIISEPMAHHYWPKGDAIGRSVLVNGRSYRIVGIVGDLAYSDPANTDPDSLLFLPLTQRYSSSFFVALRPRSSLADTMAQLRYAVAGLDGLLPLENVRTLESVTAGQARRMYR